MNFKIKNIGAYSGRPAAIIELTVSTQNAEIVEEVTNMYGKVDVNLIDSLRALADELEEQNNKLAEPKEL